MTTTKHTSHIAEQLSQLRDLLIVIERGGDTSPDVLYKIAIEKSQYITTLVEAWRDESNPMPVEIPAEYAQWIESDIEQPAPIADEEILVEDKPQDAPIEDSNVLLDESDFIEVALPDTPQDSMPVEEEYIAPFVEDEVEDCHVVEDEIDTPAVIDDSVENVVVEEDDDVTIMEDDVVVVADAWDDADDDDGWPDDDEDDEATDDDDDDDDDDDEIVIDEFYNRGEPLDSEPLTVGEMMSVRQAKEMRKALSLNDRFRFRRELFGNSDINMNETLNLIDTMNDFTEASEYLLQDLGWSIEDPVVQEFIQLVERHFKQR